MSPQDGRVVTNFITQALGGRPVTIYGDGTHTRSFCYVDDLIRGIVAMIDSAERGPVNLGNPEELSVDRPGLPGAAGHPVLLAGRVPAAAGGRPGPPVPGHRPGPEAAGLAARGTGGGGDPAHARTG